MRYIVMDIRAIDYFIHEFDNREEAIEFAKDDFEHLSKLDQEECLSYCVLKSVSSDEDSENFYTWNIICKLK